MKQDKILAFNHRIPRNAPGHFYVTDACNNCGLCHTKAQKWFHLDGGTGKAYVWQQPATAHDKGEVHKMMSQCPKHCIFDNGDKFEWPKANPFKKHVG